MFPRAAASRRRTASRSSSRSRELDDFVDKELKTDDKLLYLGERTISRLGCFGCHTIPGFENAKPIGTALNDWGVKNPARLEFRAYRRIPDRPASGRQGRLATGPISSTRRRSRTRRGWGSSTRSCIGRAATTT